ncbi:regulator of G protein signaling domain-containing protein [Spinellus fusiger]|nr:regulator of G protein signaling domain-containing protein [Spinellus fusiger]
MDCHYISKTNPKYLVIVICTMPRSLSEQAYTSMMKFTVEGRPFLKDTHDLLGALIMQVPIRPHRYLFRSYPNTFTSEDALQSLGSLCFSHTFHTCDPTYHRQHHSTTTTTTFHMERVVAKRLWEVFLSCHLIENAVDSSNRLFREKGLWQLTSKGLCILQDFCIRTRADMTRIKAHFGQMNSLQLIRLERDTEDDTLVLDRYNVSTVFKAMFSLLPNEKQTDALIQHQKQQQTSPKTCSSSLLSVSLSTHSTATSFCYVPVSPVSVPFSMSSPSSSQGLCLQVLNNYLLTLDKSDKEIQSNFNGMASVFSTSVCCEWILLHSTVDSYKEAQVIAVEFLRRGWLEFQDPKLTGRFKISKTALLTVTKKGQSILSDRPLSTAIDTPLKPRKDQQTLGDCLEGLFPQSTDSPTTQLPTPHPSMLTYQGSLSYPSHAFYPKDISRAFCSLTDPKEGNLARLQLILGDPPSRSLFRDFLSKNFCQENLDFWIDHDTLKRKYRLSTLALVSHHQKSLLEDAYALWAMYIAPGASAELNVEHSLRQEITRLASSAVTVVPVFSLGHTKPVVLVSTPSVSECLKMMLKRFVYVEEHICRLMALDSVPRFIKTDKYCELQQFREEYGRSSQV